MKDNKAMDKGLITEYLKNVVELEKQVYLQKEVLNELNAKINSLGYANSIQEPTLERVDSLDQEYIGEVTKNWAIGGACAAMLSTFIFGCSDSSNIFCTAFNLIEAMIPSFLICLPGSALIGYTIGAISARAKRSEYNSYLRSKYQDDIAEYDRLKYEDAKRVQDEIVQREILRSEYSALYAQYEKSAATLQRFYDANIIYGKYHHDFAAVASFWDYFKSGRCSTLGENRGGDGAYNTYENELRQNIIINKLDVVINNLNEIKANQYSLAEAISEGNRISRELVSATEHLALEQKRTAENSAIAAYNSGRAADELNQIKWLQLWS